MSALFSTISMRNLELHSRIAVAPMCQYIAQNGTANDWHLMHLGSLSMGAGSLIMTEATHVSAQGRITPGCLGLYDGHCETALKRVVDFCKAHGTAAMGIQLAHAGRKASTRIPLKGGQPLQLDEGAWQTVGPSALAYAPDWHVPHPLDPSGLEAVKSEFVEATIRAARIGFDLAELHMAHGYLLHQFLSPLSNQRDDAYGGSLENRMRYPLEIFEAARNVWPSARPLGVRVSATDWVEGGWDLESTIVLAKELRELGCDFVDVSSGGNDRRQKIELKPGYQVHLATAVKEQASIPAWAVGLIIGARQAEAIIAEGKADMIALARGAMDDPRWAWHAAQKLGAEIVYPDQYVRAAPSKWPGAGEFRCG